MVFTWKELDLHFDIMNNISCCWAEELCLLYIIYAWTVINIECYMPCVSICDNKDMPYTYMLIIYYMDMLWTIPGAGGGLICHFPGNQ